MLSFETVERAIRIEDWFLAQQLEILAATRQAAKAGKQAAILEVLAANPKGITARIIERALHLSTADEAHLLLDGMVRDSILVAREIATGGRPQRVYRSASQVQF